jgi:hypothetical protein
MHFRMADTQGVGAASEHPGPSCVVVEETETDVEIVEGGEEGETIGPTPVAHHGQVDLEPATYRLGRSKVTETVLDEYMADGLLHRTMRNWCRAPGHEEMPQPEPYEVVVIRDFFKARLRFPCEDFIEEVLQRSDLQIHHLTLNAFARMSVFAMALKMAGCALSVNLFVRYYEMHFHKKTVTDRRTKVEMVNHYGSYNFVPKKTKGIVSIVLAC